MATEHPTAPAPPPDPFSELDAALVGRLARVRLVALDVDGVLTDGSVVYLGDEELQRFHVADGQALRWLAAEGLAVVWITGRGCRATERRAAELGAALYRDVRDKEAVLARLQAEQGIDPAETLAMGDDLPDLALARRAGLLVAPADACGEVRARADLVCRRRGGAGAVREAAEALLRARGAWDRVLARHGQEAGGAG